MSKQRFADKQQAELCVTTADKSEGSAVEYKFRAGVFNPQLLSLLNEIFNRGPVSVWPYC